MSSDKVQKNDAREEKPPYSNRGVENTERGVLRACVDWLQATLTFFYDMETACDLLGVDKSKFNLQERGMYGYRSHYKYGHISVLADGGSNMGVHIQLSGQGCREYEEMGIKNWQQLLSDIRELQGKFARIDLAIDDVIEDGQKHYFNVETLIRKIRSDSARSYFKKVKLMESVVIEGGKTEGQTLYVGKESSDIQIRFYNKGEERLAKGKELEEGVTGWIRTEIQTRRKRADVLAGYIINNEDVGKTASGILKNYINFLVPSNDENKGRWKVCKWWEDFLGDVDKLKLTLVAPDRTIDRTKAWLDKQIAPSLGMIYMAYGGDEKAISLMIADGVNRLTDSQLQLAIDYQKMLEQEKDLMDYQKKSMWQDYLFRTGAHRLGNEKEKVTAPHSDQETDIELL